MLGQLLSHRLRKLLPLFAALLQLSSHVLLLLLLLLFSVSGQLVICFGATLFDEGCTVSKSNLADEHAS